MKQREIRKKPQADLKNSQDKLWRKAEKIFPGGVFGTVYYPGSLLEKAGLQRIFIPARGEGAYVWDLEGNTYLDYTMGMGTLITGHCHPSIVKAVRKQVGRGIQFLSMINEPGIVLAEKVCRDVPAIEKLRFASTGSEAVNYAIRVARAFTGRSHVLRFEGAYHGNHDLGVMSYLPSADALPEFPEARPDSAGILKEVKGHTLVGPFNDVQWLRRFFKDRGSELAAVIVEPIQRFIPAAPEFLQALREETARHGACLIFDEMVTGYRLGLQGAQGLYGVVPDLVIIGKTLSGGIPFSIVGGRENIVELFNPRLRPDPRYTYQSGGFNGNPVSMIAALAVRKLLGQAGTYDRLFSLGAALRNGIVEISRAVAVPVHVSGEGPLCRVYFTEKPVRDYRSSIRQDNELLARLVAGLLRRRILVNAKAMFYISIAHGDDDINRTLSAIKEILGEIKNRHRGRR